MGGVSGKGTTDDPELPEMEEADADEMVDVCGQRHCAVNQNAEVSGGFGRLDVGIGYPDFVSRTMMETTT